MEIRYTKPGEIEKRSMEIITSEMKTSPMECNAPVVRRVIHTTADFDYENTLRFSDDAVNNAVNAIKSGVTIVTDTNMAKSGINKAALARHNCRTVCFMAEPDVAEEAAERQVTRAVVSMERAAGIEGPVILAIGNAPTALIKAGHLIKEGRISPVLVIGVPVGFVNVTESKEFIMNLDVPFIVAEGRKGGSTVAAAICNALLYMADESGSEKK